jgi:hypothetical protein
MQWLLRLSHQQQKGAQSGTEWVSILVLLCLECIASLHAIAAH